MKLRRRQLLATAALLPAPFILCARAAAPEKLLIAEPLHSVGYLPLYVAAAQGFFTPEALDVQIVTMDSSGAAHTNAVLSGQAFAFIGGPEHDAFAHAKGAELRAVANVVDRGNVYFVARTGIAAPAPDASMAEIGAFLKGRSIATGFFGGTPNSITRYVVIASGLKLSDVTLAEATAAGELAMVKTGHADIAVVTEPQVTQGIRAGLWQEPFFNVPKRLGPYAYSTLNVRLDSIEKTPKTVAGFVRGVMRGLEFTYAEPAKAAAVARAQFPTMAAEDLKATLDRSFADQIWSHDGSISPQSWTTAKAVVTAAGILHQDVPYASVIDMQFLPPAAKAG